MTSIPVVSTEARRKVAEALSQQGEYLSDAAEDALVGNLKITFQQCVGYVSTALFRLKQCEVRLLPVEGELSQEQEEIKILVQCLFIIRGCNLFLFTVTAWGNELEQEKLKKSNCNNSYRKTLNEIRSEVADRNKWLDKECDQTTEDQSDG